jgi:hypothetical protein
LTDADADGQNISMPRVLPRSWVSASPLLLAAACGGEPTAAPDASTAPTYFQDVKPIVDAKCGTCHNPDGIAPFGLTTYAELFEVGGVALQNIELGLMPPWPANPDCNDYHADRSLTDAQKAVFAAWVEAGMPEGDPANPGAPLDVEQVGLSRVDLALTMDQAYTPRTTADGPDDYRCFVLPFPADVVDTTKYITGFRAAPGNPKVVHHVIAFYAGPDALAEFQQLDAADEGDGYTCFGGTGGSGRPEMIGGWAPGGLGYDFPAGTGLEVEPGSAVIMQVHYNVVAAGAEPDQTAVEMKLDDAVDRVAQVQPWTNPQWVNGSGMTIPAGETDVVHAFEFDPTVVLGGEFTLYTASMHQHNLGSANRASVVRADGGDQCLLQIDDWNFHWQGSYALREPVQVRPGDMLRVECHWDNSPENQPIVGGEQMPPKDVAWGEGTGDEMCIGFFYVAPGAP